MTLELIAAVARNGVIGRGGGLPWRLSADLKRFKRLTMGSALIVGRKTYEDSIARPLPGRQMIVVSRQADLSIPDVVVAHSLDEALSVASSSPRAFCAGGGELFRQALPDCEQMHITWVESDVEGDVRFPDVEWQQWRIVSEMRLPAGKRDQYPTTFREYRRLIAAKS